MTQTVKHCALPECDRMIEPQSDGNPPRKYCSAEHSSAARRRRLQARANGQQHVDAEKTRQVPVTTDSSETTEFDQFDDQVAEFDDLEHDSEDAAPSDSNRIPPAIRHRVRLRFPSRRTGIALGAVAAVAVLGLAAFEIQQATQTEQATAAPTGAPAATTATSSPSTPSSSTPPTPAGLTARPGNGEAVLCWDAAADATAYYVYSHDVTASGGWVRSASPVTDGLCWTAKPLVNGDRYEFRVTGSNLSGESGFSNTAQTTPTGPATTSGQRR
jgi:hypothetical protein